MSQVSNVAVIGAGLSGLATAYRLTQQGCQVTLFEASDAIGGNIRGNIDENWLADSGYGLINWSDPLIQSLVSELDLRDEVIPIRPQGRKRFIAYNGRLRRIPNTVGGAIMSGYLPMGARMRLLLGGIFKKQVNDNDTVSAVLERFLGASAVSLVAEPLCMALYAGSPNQLNFKHTFPSLYRHLAEKGRISRAIRMSLKEQAISLKKPGFVGFRFGMPTLVNALADRLKGETFFGAKVVQVTRRQGQWVLSIELGTEVRYFVCDKVVFATPAHELGTIQTGDGYDSDLQAVAGMPYAPLTVLNMGFKKSDLAHKLDSAGFLVHKSESNSLLGVMFTSSLLDERTPGGHHLITVFVGGVDHADFAVEPINRIKTVVLKDLNTYLGVKAYPVYVKPFSYAKAIPQTGQAHAEILGSIARFEQRHPGIFLAGQYRFGHGIETCIKGAFGLADRMTRSEGDLL